MYSLPYFKEPDPQKVVQFVKDHPFAFLTGCSAENAPVVTQVPVFIDERDGRLFLSGHMMRNTDHHKAFLHNSSALAVFTGPHSYVSSTWYTEKQQGGTWNYMSVHARGTLTFLDEQALRDVLKRTTNYFENNPASEGNFEHIPEEYVARMVKAIVAFEIEVKELDHVFKLSQNRDEKSYDTIIEELQKGNADAKEISDLMKKRKGQVFNG